MSVVFIYRKHITVCSKECPHDLDAGQSMLEGLPMERKFKSYVGLRGAENKLRKYLKEFQFTDIATAEQSIDWVHVPWVRLG